MKKVGILVLSIIVLLISSCANNAGLAPMKSAVDIIVSDTSSELVRQEDAVCYELPGDLDFTLSTGLGVENGTLYWLVNNKEKSSATGYPYDVYSVSLDPNGGTFRKCGSIEIGPYLEQGSFKVFHNSLFYLAERNFCRLNLETGDSTVIATFPQAKRYTAVQFLESKAVFTYDDPDAGKRELLSVDLNSMEQKKILSNAFQWSETEQGEHIGNGTDILASGGLSDEGFYYAAVEMNSEPLSSSMETAVWYYDYAQNSHLKVYRTNSLYEVLTGNKKQIIVNRYRVEGRTVDPTWVYYIDGENAERIHYHSSPKYGRVRQAIAVGEDKTLLKTSDELVFMNHSEKKILRQTLDEQNMNAGLVFSEKNEYRYAWIEQNKVFVSKVTME